MIEQGSRIFPKYSIAGSRQGRGRYVLFEFAHGEGFPMGRVGFLWGYFV